MATDDRVLRTSSFISAVFCSFYISWACYRYCDSIPRFRGMFKDLGVVIPWRTDFVLSVPQPVIIAIAVLLVAVVIAKEFFMANKSAALGVTLAVYLFAAGFAAFVVDSIATPFLNIIESIGDLE